MKYIYTEQDLDKISWQRIDQYIDKIYNDVSDFLIKNDLTIKYIVPILRGGGVPSVILSHKFNVIDLLPVQLKYNGNYEVKIPIDIFNNVGINNNECILLVEGNHVNGTTSLIAKDMILNKFGKDTKIIYVSITKDYSNKDSVNDVIFSTCGFYTNEKKKLSERECENLGINYVKVALFPWESVEEELKELNDVDY